MTGWIKTHRKITEWQWYTDVPVKTLFSHLILIANYEDVEWRGQAIKRGERVTSAENLAIETGLSVQQVRTAIKKLKSTNEIVVKSTNKFTVITITNYDDYQSEDAPSNKQATNKQQTNNKPSTTNKEEQEIKKNKKDISLTHETICLDDIGDWLKTKSFFFDFEAEIETFKIHYRKTGGKMNNGKPVSDWRAALQNWFNNAQKFNNKTGAGNGRISSKTTNFGGGRSSADQEFLESCERITALTDHLIADRNSA